MAADSVMMIGWNRQVVGREAQGVELFQEALNQYATWQREGRIESFEPVLLDPNVGGMNGFILIRGDHKKLAELTSEEHWVDMTSRGNYLLEGFSVTTGEINEGLKQRLGRWRKIIKH